MPLANLPMQVRTSDDDWIGTVDALLGKGAAVIIDLSERSESVEIESELVRRNVVAERVVSLVDGRAVNSDFDTVERAVSTYTPSYLNRPLGNLVKVAMVIAIWAVNAGVLRWMVLIVLPFVLIPSISRADRRSLREAVRSAVAFSSERTAELA